MTEEKTIYLIDGTAYIHRAYHAIRGLTNSKGMPTNAIFGFTRMLMKLMEDRNPEYVGMFFDAKGPTFRHGMYAAYKANRPPMPEDMAVQIPYIKKVTTAFNLPIIEMQGYEADDLIGTLARIAEKKGFTVVMITGDKDFMQLVTEKSTIWDPMKESATDFHTIKEKFGIEPHQMIDVQGLSGDTADNIPGVPGIGQKTAVALIQTYNSMQELYEKLDTISKKKQRENLENYKAQAFLSRKLVTINTAAPLEMDPAEFKVTAPDKEKLAGLFQDLEFRQLQQSVPEQADLSCKDYQAVMDQNQLVKLIAQLGKADLISLDTETTSTNPMLAELVGLSFAVKANQAYYIPCRHHYLGAPDQLKLKAVLESLKPVLENPQIKKIGQNIKYDWMVLARNGINLDGVVFDTMLASYLLNPSKRAHNLDQIALDFLDHKTITYEQVAGKGKNALLFSQVPLDKAVPYACEDADITLMARDVLVPKLKALGLDDLMAAVEMPLVPVLMRMEMRGAGVDAARLRELSRSFEKQLDALEGSIYGVAGEAFNINSPKQLATVLFDGLGLPVIKRTKTGPSTDVSVLEELGRRHPLPAKILDYRSITKLLNTYVTVLPTLIAADGRIHSRFHQTVAATGRLSSSHPNLQNIPIRTERGRKIRRAFVAPDGYRLLSADYSQIELRLLAHFSGDEKLIQAFVDGADIHRATAAQIFGLEEEQVTDAMRRDSKTINFGILYGMGAFRLAQQIDVPLAEAKRFIEHYFARYPDVRAYLDGSVQEARETGYVTTLLGRRRPLPEVASSNRMVRANGERMAINTPLQGSAADIIKVAMLRVDDALRREGLASRLVLQVHDELVLEVPEAEVDAARGMVTREMNAAASLKVPLVVDTGVGVNWDEAH